jgi:sugar phosphate isomerase/epimerase
MIICNYIFVKCVVVMRVLLSVPHSLCVKRTRDCDERALVLANSLRALFEKHGYKVALIASDIYRTPGHDGNRFNTRNTDFRKRLLAEFEHVDLVIDCHSFPTGAWQDIPRDAKLVFLLMDETLNYKYKIGERIAQNTLALHPAHVYVTQGSHENDILLQAYEMYQKTGILVEIQEELSENEIKEYAAIVFAATIETFKNIS